MKLNVFENVTPSVGYFMIMVDLSNIRYINNVFRFFNSFTRLDCDYLHHIFEGTNKKSNFILGLHLIFSQKPLNIIHSFYSKVTICLIK